VPTQRKVREKSPVGPRFSARLAWPRPGASRLVHLVCMETTSRPTTALGPVLTLSQLATQLGVSTQTLYDLRSRDATRRGAGPSQGVRVSIVGHLEVGRVCLSDLSGAGGQRLASVLGAPGTFISRSWPLVRRQRGLHPWLGPEAVRTERDFRIPVGLGSNHGEQGGQDRQRHRRGTGELWGVQLDRHTSRRPHSRL
jgi:hypothetical protein